MTHDYLCPWGHVDLGEGHKFLILVQRKVIQFYLSLLEGHTNVFPLNFRGVLRLVD